MKNPARKDGQSNTQIEKILADSGLLDILRKYGEVSVSKDDIRGATIGGEISVHVIRDSRSRKKIPKIYDDIQRSTKFDSYRLANWGSAISKGGQVGGHHISVIKRIENKRWKINIFLTKPEGGKKEHAKINISKESVNLLARLGRLNKSKGLLYVAYTLIAGLIFFVSLGVLNSVYNGEFGFEIFSGEPSAENQIIIDPEQIIDTVSEEEENLDVEEPSTEEESEMPIEEAPQETDTATSTEIVEETPVVSKECIFNTNIRFGDRGEDVERLQMFLADQGTEIYPDGLVTGSFGTLTREAVVRFQESYLQAVLSPWEISQGTGFVGTTTRAKINELCGLEEINP